jgi:hypothetical protein
VPVGIYPSYPVLSPAPVIVGSRSFGPGAYQQWAPGPGSYRSMTPGPGYIQPMPLGNQPYSASNTFGSRPFGGGGGGHFGRR